MKDPTYSQDEVQEILNEVKQHTLSDAESEMISVAHSNVALLTQYLSQAEQWHLTMTAPDLQRIDDRQVLDGINKFEIEKLDTVGSNIKSAQKLAPMMDAGVTALLHQEIERLKLNATSKNNSELDSLKAKVNALEQEMQNKLQESTAVQQMKKLLQHKNLELKDARQKLEDLNKVK